MALRVQQHIIRLDVPVDDALPVDISQGTAQLGNPKPHRFLGEGLSRDMESQVAAGHQVDDDVPRREAPCKSAAAGIEADGHSHVLNVLKAVAKIANERVVEMFQHPPLAYDVPDALGSND